jgi:hypothetical protein
MESHTHLAFSCWIGPRWALIGGFLIPLAVCVAFNCVLFVLIVRSLHRASQQRRSAATGLKQQSHMREIRAIVSISVLMGLTWLFAAFIETGEANSSLVFQYLFAIFVTLQGFAIFLLQCLFSDTVREAVRQQTAVASSSASASHSTASSRVPGATSVLKYSSSSRNAEPKSTARLSAAGPFAMSSQRLTATLMSLSPAAPLSSSVPQADAKTENEGYLVLYESELESALPADQTEAVKGKPVGRQEPDSVSLVLAANPLSTAALDPVMARSLTDSSAIAGSNEPSPMENRDFGAFAHVCVCVCVCG